MLFDEVSLSVKNGQSATVSKTDWIKLALLSLLNVIPIVGSIAYLVVLIVLAANHDVAPSVRNYVVAGFIVAGVALALGIVLAIATFAIAGGAAVSLHD